MPTTTPSRRNADQISLITIDTSYRGIRTMLLTALMTFVILVMIKVVTSGFKRSETSIFTSFFVPRETSDTRIKPLKAFLLDIGVDLKSIMNDPESISNSEKQIPMGRIYDTNPTSSSSSLSPVHLPPLSNPTEKNIPPAFKRITHHLNWVSPSNGTDIRSHPAAILRCTNQTMCVTPQLQLHRVFNIYYCAHVSYGVRFYFLVREGLLLHPNVNMVKDPAQADFIVYLPTSADWRKSECNNPQFAERLVVLDEGDGSDIFQPPGKSQGKDKWNLIYFKRSYVQRKDGKFRGYMPYLRIDNSGMILPMTYTIAEAYIKPSYIPYKQREVDLLCTLRGSQHDPTRLRVKLWVEEYAKARGISKYHAGELNTESRTVISRGYFGKMQTAKIIVTSNPSNWEGDFRMMEALGAGAAVLIDNMMVPRPHPLVAGRHIMYYDNQNKTDLFEKLDAMMENPEMTQKLAARGYLWSLKHHRAVNLVDYVLRSVHTLLLQQMNPKSMGIYGGADVNINRDLYGGYTQTGFDMRQLALNRDKKMRQK